MKVTFVKNIKRWWLDTANLFRLEIEIRLLGISVALDTLLFGFEIGTYIPLHFYNRREEKIFSKNLRFKQHKRGDIELWFRNNYKTGINIYKHIHDHHTPFNLEISILGFTFLFYHYDTRHWDDDNDRYEECYCDGCNQETT